MKMSNKFSMYQNETLCIIYRQYTTFPYWFKIIFAGDGFSQIIFTEWTHRIACLQKIQRISDDFIFSCHVLMMNHDDAESRLLQVPTTELSSFPTYLSFFSLSQLPQVIYVFTSSSWHVSYHHQFW